EEGRERRDDCIRLVAEQGTEPSAQLRPECNLGLSDLSAQPPEQDLDEGPTGKSAIGVTASLEPGGGVGPCDRQLGEEARLAYSGCSGEEDDSTAPGRQIDEDVVQYPELPFTTHDR